MHLENLTHEFIHCMSIDKSEPLLGLLRTMGEKRAILIFCSSIASCHFVEFLLKKEGVKAVTLHSDLPKPMRQQNIAEFR